MTHDEFKLFCSKLENLASPLLTAVKDRATEILRERAEVEVGGTMPAMLEEERSAGRLAGIKAYMNRTGAVLAAAISRWNFEHSRPK